MTFILKRTSGIPSEYHNLIQVNSDSMRLLPWNRAWKLTLFNIRIAGSNNLYTQFIPYSGWVVVERHISMSELYYSLNIYFMGKSDVLLIVIFWRDSWNQFQNSSVTEWYNKSNIHGVISNSSFVTGCSNCLEAGSGHYWSTARKINCSYCIWQW